MSMQDVTIEMFAKARVRPVVGFVFRFNPADPGYGVCAVTDGTMPQIKNIEAAAAVGKILQESIFGEHAQDKTATFYNEHGEPDFSNMQGR